MRSPRCSSLASFYGGVDVGRGRIEQFRPGRQLCQRVKVLRNHRQQLEEANKGGSESSETSTQYGMEPPSFINIPEKAARNFTGLIPGERQLWLSGPRVR